MVKLLMPMSPPCTYPYSKDSTFLVFVLTTNFEAKVKSTVSSVNQGEHVLGTQKLRM